MTARVAILAAGQGKRMKQDIPKALTPVGGKPILQYLVESIESSGIDKQPIVVVGPEAPKLCETFGKTCDYVVQEEQLGTGHAVMVTKETVGDAEMLIVLYGDHPFISPDSLKRLADAHKEGGNVMTMMTTQISGEESWHCAFEHWGRILRDPIGHIIGNRQYKDATDEEKAIKERDPALYCFDTKWLWENIKDLGKENAQGEYYLTDLVTMIVEQGKTIGSLEIRPEEAVGVNTQDECKIAEEVLMSLRADAKQSSYEPA